MSLVTAAGLLAAVSTVASAATLGGTAQAGTRLPAHAPAVLPAQGNLLATAAVSATDVWAVGHDGDNLLTENYNGRSWRQVSAPAPTGLTHGLFYGVAAVSATDVWAVGSYNNSQNYLTLIEHWNGHAWAVVPSPDIAGDYANFLESVNFDSPSDGWAVGYNEDSDGDSATLVEHWDGTQWQTVPSANPGLYDDTELYAVDALSADNVWAAGVYYTAGGDQYTIAEHWDGTSWIILNMPSSQIEGSQFNAIDAVSPDDVWLAGYDSTSTGAVDTLLEYWNGDIWQTVDGLNGSATVNSLQAISFSSPTSAVATGFYVSPQGQYLALAERWNGHTWKLTAPRDPAGATECELLGVAAISPTDAWAVGSYNSADPVAEHWRGDSWHLSQHVS